MKLSFIRLFILFSLILIASCTKRQSLEGTILDKITKQPVEGVSIAKGIKDSIVTYSDSNGHFEYIDLPGHDTIMLVFFRNSYKTLHIEFRGIMKDFLVYMEKAR